MAFMVIRKTIYLMLVLTFTLHGPFVRLYDAQEEQVPAQEAANVSGTLLAGIITAFNIPFRGLLCGADTVWGFVVVGQVEAGDMPKPLMLWRRVALGRGSLHLR